MESLFVRQAPRRGRICLMLGASLLLHGSLVGIAALWTQPQPEVYDGGDWIIPNDGDLSPNPSLTPVLAPVETPEPTTTPDVVDKPDPTPPLPESSPDFAEVSSPTPPRRPTTSVKSVTAVRTTNASAGPRTSSVRSGNNAPGVPSTGPANAPASWVMPHPPYPHMPMAVRPTGTTTVRITTDASGRVSNVVILKSAGSAILDNQTVSYVRMNWHGPPNAERTTEFVYQVR